MDYAEFLARKSIRAAPSGFDPRLPWPELMKQFQRDCATWACRRGRSALFEGTGLGKTVQELAWAQQVADYTSGRVMIFTPLAVAEQTVREAVHFGIPDVAYAPDERSAKTQIVVTNYDRRDRFDISEFAGVVLDESGIIKDHDSKTRVELTEACRNVPYLLCGSATPAPNDWTELGQHAEFLGVLSAKEMLSMFFVHEGSVRANEDAEEWRLKRHAETDFWRWVASWAIMIRHPRDIGYEEPGYDLPPLNLHQVTVRTTQAPEPFTTLFQIQANTLRERLSARKNSVDERVAAAAQIVATAPDEPWLIWCNLNTEADAICKAIPGTVNVQGSDKVAYKIEKLLGFTQGDPLRLCSKPSIAGRGMNFQHCSKMVFIGLNDSFEQLFQALRRCWRFGQERPVDAYLIASELEGAVVANLHRKEERYEHMATAMAEHMKDLTAANVRGGRQQQSVYEPKIDMEVPSWLPS